MSVRLLKPGERLGEPTIMETLNFCASIGVYYPRFLYWMKGVVKPGLKDGTRKIFWRRDDVTQALVGIGIAKKTPDERKVCTLRVDPQAIGNEIGYRLMEAMMAWLETDKPHFTVHEDNRIKLNSLINHYGFEKTSESRGLYVPHKTELLFNEY